MFPKVGRNSAGNVCISFKELGSFNESFHVVNSELQGIPVEPYSELNFEDAIKLMNAKRASRKV